MINVALFGFGRIGQMHGENIFKHPKFYLKYVYDRNMRLAKKSEKLGFGKGFENKLKKVFNKLQKRIQNI